MIRKPKNVDPYRERLDAKLATLPPASRRVASYIDSNRLAVLASSAIELAARTETSDATVIRTVQALGFAGLAETEAGPAGIVGPVVHTGRRHAPDTRRYRRGYGPGDRCGD